MASDEKRREVAARLRQMADAHHAVEASRVARALGLEYEVYGTVIAFNSAAVQALADLIDQPDEMRGRPTCEMKGRPGERYGVCTRCGAFVRRDAVTNCTSVIPVKFCPNCRAKVI